MADSKSKLFSTSRAIVKAQFKYPLYFFFCLLVFTACEADEPFILDSDDVQVEASTAPANYQQLLDLVNELRAGGCLCGDQNMPAVGTLRWNQQLAAAAVQHSQDMANNQHFSHTGTDGSSGGDRIQQQGYRWQTYGENIAQGYASVASVFKGWKDSPGHCRNMMNANFKEMGAGVKNRYWTQDFATAF